MPRLTQSQQPPTPTHPQSQKTAVTHLRGVAQGTKEAKPAVPRNRAAPEAGLVSDQELVDAGLAEYAEETTSNPAKGDDPFDGDGSEAAGPAAKKAVAKKTPAKKTVARKATPSATGVVAASDAWFAPLDDTEDFLNVLWYGRPGSTKTTSLATAASSAPEGSKVLIINAEGGLKVRALRKHGVDTSKIVVFPNPATDDVLDDENLMRVFLRVQKDLMEDPKSWFAVGIDSITDVGQILVDRAQQARVSRSAVALDPNFVDRDDYGVSAKIIRKHLRAFRDLPCHFLVTATLRRDVDEDTGKVMYGPAVSPAVSNDLQGYVDIVCMIKAADEDGPVRGLVRGSKKYAVKDRFEMLPTVMVEPTFDRMHEYMTDAMTEETDPMQESLPAKPAPATKKGKGSATVGEEDDTPEE